MKPTYILFIVLLSVVVLASCKSDTNKKGVEGAEEITQVKDSLVQAIYILPSPNEILSEIFIDGVKINPNLVNDYSNAEKYIDTRTQAVNLGVYIADFAYLSFSDETTTELEYLKVIQQLAESVQMYGIVGNKTMNRIQENLTSQDSLNRISQELYYKISTNLESSNRENIFTLISAGAIIESLYLSVSLVDDFDDYKEVILRMYEQKFVFDNFYEYASLYKDDPYVRQILDQLDILKEIFDQIEKQEKPMKVERSSNDKIAFQGGTSFVVNPESFNNFKRDLVILRNEIINTKVK